MTPPRLACLLAALIVSTLAPPGAESEELPEGLGQANPLAPPDTSSPRATLQSFLTDANAGWSAYLGRDEDEGRRGAEATALRHLRRAARCLDLSELPPSQVEQAKSLKPIMLLDVFNRIALPDPLSVPDADEVEARALAHWTLPDTPIAIARVQQGSRAGEWLFTPETVTRVKEFYLRTRDLPLQAGAVVEDGYELSIHLPGWMIPLAWIEALPEWARAIYLEQPVWKWALLTALVLFSVAAGRAAIRVSQRTREGRRSARRALLGPASILLLALVARYLLWTQIGLSGTLLAIAQVALTAVFYLAAAWTAMILGSAVADQIVSSPRIRPGSIDAHLVRLGARIVSFVVAVLIVMEGGRSLGVPLAGLIAGLGVGGLAVALAAQSTIENLIGSITIFADRPVRVGDLCSFGEHIGTVERIGLRSTRIRALDRSVVTVPNAEFSRLKLINLTERDRMLFRTTVSLRLETTPDQLRLVLARLRELLLAHPRVDEDPARVRVVAAGPHAFDLEVFAYVKTRDWSEFLAIREDLFLRMIDVVGQAGTSFAPPAHTTYVARDGGLDDERARAAEAQVAKWRRESALPFPEFAPAQREKLEDTLDFPPAGSPGGPPTEEPPR